MGLDLRISLRFRDTGLDTLYFSWTEASSCTFVFRSGKARANRSLNVRHRGTGGGSPFSSLSGHCQLSNVNSGNSIDVWVQLRGQLPMCSKMEVRTGGKC